MAPIITVEQASYAYPLIHPNEEPFWVFQNLNLDIDAGEFVSIMGPTGVGKSTFCLALNGIVPQSTGGFFRGNIFVDGLNTKSHPVSELAQRVGIVFQEPEAQLFHTNPESEVAFGLENLGVTPAEMRKRVDWALSLLQLQDYRHTPTAHLSGGQKQRVAIAAILAMRPKILVLDEPTANLDAQGKEEIVAGIYELRQSGDTTIILVSQESEFVAELSDRIVVFDQGRVVMEGSPEDVFSKAQALQAIGLNVPQVTELAGCLNRRYGKSYSFYKLEQAYQDIIAALEAR